MPFAIHKINAGNRQIIILMKKAHSWAFFVDFYTVSGDNSVSKQAFRVIFNISKEL